MVVLGPSEVKVASDDPAGRVGRTGDDRERANPLQPLLKEDGMLSLDNLPCPQWLIR